MLSLKTFFSAFSLPFTPDLKFWFWPCRSKHFGSFLPTFAAAHPISLWAVSAKRGLSTGTHQKVLGQNFPSVSFMSAFPIVHHMPKQIRLKAFFSSYCVCKSTGFQSNWFPKLVTGLMQCGGAETRYSDRADMNKYKVIKQQQLNPVF